MPLPSIAVLPSGDKIGNPTNTFDNPVDREKIINSGLLSEEDIEIVSKIEGEKFPIWGVKPIHKSKFGRLKIGDLALFYQKKNFVACAEIAFKTHNEKLARIIWEGREDKWDCFFILIKREDIEIPISGFNEALGYKTRNVV